LQVFFFIFFIFSAPRTLSKRSFLVIGIIIPKVG
jgi:hypothetical protein